MGGGGQGGGLWVGWPGPELEPGEGIPEAEVQDTSPTAQLLSSQVLPHPGSSLLQVHPVHLTEEDFQLYYNGCCNATFWPLFHSMPDRSVSSVSSVSSSPSTVCLQGGLR